MIHSPAASVALVSSAASVVLVGSAASIVLFKAAASIVFILDGASVVIMEAAIAELTESKLSVLTAFEVSVRWNEDWWAAFPIKSCAICDSRMR